MQALETSDRELAALMTEATKLAAEYWASLEERPTYPSTSGTATTSLFDRPWPDEGQGRDVLNDLRQLPSTPGRARVKSHRTVTPGIGTLKGLIQQVFSGF